MTLWPAFIGGGVTAAGGFWQCDKTYTDTVSVDGFIPAGVDSFSRRSLHNEDRLINNNTHS